MNGLAVHSVILTGEIYICYWYFDLGIGIPIMTMDARVACAVKCHHSPWVTGLILEHRVICKLILLISLYCSGFLPPQKLISVKIGLTW
jgi:hypothetical protein